MPTEPTKPSRGRPKTGRVRLALRVLPKTRRRILAMMDEAEKDTPGKVVDDVFDKEMQ